MANTGMMMRPIGEVGRHSGWFLALGIAFIVGGFLAIVMPLVASIAVAIAVGWVFILIGIVQLVHTWQVRGWGGAIWQAIIGGVILVGGIAIITDPIVATVTLTLLLGIVFLAKGIMQIVLGINYRPHLGWGWIVGAGALSAVVGVLIVLAWPISAAWALGTLAGISLMFSGWSYIMIAMAARRLATV